MVCCKLKIGASYERVEMFYIFSTLVDMIFKFSLGNLMLRIEGTLDENVRILVSKVGVQVLDVNRLAGFDWILTDVRDGFLIVVT